MYVCMCVYTYIYVSYDDKYAYALVHLDEDPSKPFKANVPIISNWGQQKLHLFFYGVFRWCGNGAFARNGSFTNMVHGL